MPVGVKHNLPTLVITKFIGVLKILQYRAKPRLNRMVRVAFQLPPVVGQNLGHFAQGLVGGKVFAVLWRLTGQRVL